MTPEELQTLCEEAIRDGVGYVTIVRAGKMPRRFPRGELLCENSANERVYRFKAASLLAWMDKHMKGEL